MEQQKRLELLQEQFASDASVQALFGRGWFDATVVRVAAGSAGEEGTVTVRWGYDGSEADLPESQVRPKKAEPVQPADGRYKGVIKKILTAKGFGFIYCDTLQKDIFFKPTRILMWKEGDDVVFELDNRSKENKLAAIKVKSAHGAAAETSRYAADAARNGKWGGDDGGGGNFAGGSGKSLNSDDEDEAAAKRPRLNGGMQQQADSQLRPGIAPAAAPQLVPRQPSAPPPAALQGAVPRPAAPSDPRTELSRLAAYPQTTQDWASVQDRIWVGHKPLAPNWIRCWSRSRDVEYYVNVLTMTTTFVLADVR